MCHPDLHILQFTRQLLLHGIPKRGFPSNLRSCFQCHLTNPNNPLLPIGMNRPSKPIGMNRPSEPITFQPQVVPILGNIIKNGHCMGRYPTTVAMEEGGAPTRITNYEN